MIWLVQDNLQLLPVLAVVMLLSLSLHEYAHARVALAFGDPTALRAGRVTMNPIKHLDPVGTFVLLFAGFGWAKPVPVNPFNLRPQRMGDLLVSLAGPLSNLALALIAVFGLAIFLRLPIDTTTGLFDSIFLLLMLSALLNSALFVFNLIPLYPLDGHHILRELLPAHQREGFMRWQLQFGMWTLAALLIGPNLLSRMSGQAVPDPLDILFGKVTQALLVLITF